jgi:3-keto-5-aminohexanoate cleavage enzyme
MTMEKLIINAAITGMIPTKKDNPNVPVTPDEIAGECAKCFQAGASIFHLHARDAEGKPSYRSEIYREVIQKVKKLCPDVIVCVSCSGRVFNTFEKRSEVLNLEGDVKPDMASLTLGSLNFPKQASVTDPEMIRRLAEEMHARGILPELEVFDFGMLDYAKFLIKRGILKPPFYFNLILGSLGTLSATPFHLISLVQELPEGAAWGAAGIGRFQFPINSLAVTMGGHVRVGLEDNLYMDPDKKVMATNVALIARIANLSRAAGREICTPQEARKIIGL